jgi:hypothetical protein
MKLQYLITGLLIVILATVGIVAADGCSDSQDDPWYGWETGFHQDGYTAHVYTAVAPGFDVRPPRMSAGYWSTLINSGNPDYPAKGFFRFR